MQYRNAIIMSLSTQFSLYVCVRIVGGPSFLTQKFTGEVYRNFSEEKLLEFLEDVPLEMRIAMLFMHDDALSHFGLVF